MCGAERFRFYGGKAIPHYQLERLKALRLDDVEDDVWRCDEGDSAGDGEAGDERREVPSPGDDLRLELGDVEQGWPYNASIAGSDAGYDERALARGSFAI